MSGWADLPRDAKLYVRPTGLVSAAYAGESARVLAGGWRAFTAAEFIASVDGERVVGEIVPFSAIAAVQDALPEKQRARVGEHLERLCAPRGRIDLPGGQSLTDQRPLIMGIINVTPDSFSDGGKFIDPEAAIAHGRALAKAGADILDIGGESTRPGSDAVWEGEEKNRVMPVIEGLADAGKPISIDTRRASVAEAARDAGAVIVNDVSALREDPDALAFVVASGMPAVLMHALGDPKTMQNDPQYDDCLLEVYDFLEERVASCEEAGVERGRIFVDPGIGFGKTVRHNLELLNGLSLFHGLGCRIVLGASRKRFIGALADVEAEEERVPGSLTTALTAADQGVQVIRVHDVAETKQALDVWQGLQDTSYLIPGALDL